MLVGKTHMTADIEGMARLGIDPKSTIGVHVAQCGFEPYERDDGLHPEGYDPDPRYDEYLRKHGFGGVNPWDEWANSAEGEDGRILSGWLMRYSNRPARVPELGPFSARARSAMEHRDRSAAAKPSDRRWGAPP